MRPSVLQAYYLATPLFAVLDLGLGVSVRAVGLDEPAQRAAYYAAAFALGFVARARPRLAPWLGMGESATNLALLMLAVLLPVWSVAETLDAAALDELPSRVTNLAVSGAVLVYSFHRHQAATARSAAPRKPAPWT